MEFTNDMTMMFCIHDGLRRDVEQIARVAARTDDDPKQILRVAGGWQLFRTILHVHHTAEDEALWPPTRQKVADRPDDLALLDALESEHAQIDPLLDAVDGALADRDTGPEQLGGLIDELATTLRGHLHHEETEGLPLLDARLSAAEWVAFGMVGGQRIGEDRRLFLPWVLADASPDAAARILSTLPQPFQDAYRDEWKAAYAELRPWG